MLSSVMNEIITTERDYVKDLTYIIEVESLHFASFVCIANDAPSSITAVSKAVGTAGYNFKQ